MVRKTTKRTRKKSARRIGADLVISAPVDVAADGSLTTGLDRLTFDGYSLVWHGANPKTFTAFSGLADESAKNRSRMRAPFRKANMVSSLRGSKNLRNLRARGERSGCPLSPTVRLSTG